MNKNQELKPIVIAGIVDCRDGSIIETTTSSREVYKLSLKALELDNNTTDGTILPFQFTTHNENPLEEIEHYLEVDMSALEPLYSLLAEYRTRQADVALMGYHQEIERVSNKLAEQQKAYDICLEAVKGNPVQLEFVEELYSPLQITKDELKRLQDQLTVLENSRATA